MENKPLRRINITLLPYLLYPNLHPVLRDKDVLLLHLLAGFVRDVVGDRVRDVGYEAQDADYRKENEEWSEGMHCRCKVIWSTAGRW